MLKLLTTILKAISIGLKNTQNGWNPRITPGEAGTERDKTLPGEDSGGREGGCLPNGEGVEGAQHRVDGRAKTGGRKGGSGVCLGDTGGVDRAPLPPRRQQRGVRR